MRRFLALAFTAAMCLGILGHVRADGLDSLAESHRLTLIGGGIASNGAGLAPRSGGPQLGTITIAGVPAPAQVKKALLYWSVLAGEDPSVDFAGQPVVGSQIGRSPDPCWENVRTVDPSKDSRSYRADVTSLVGGNGSYSISGVGLGGQAGQGTGASLVVLYEDTSADFQTTILINDGSLTGGSPGPNRDMIAHAFGGLPTASPVLQAALHVGIGDGQPEFGEGALKLGGSEVLAANALDGSDGPSWDDHTVPLSASLFGPGVPMLTNSVETTGDCLVWVYAALALRTDRSAVPPPSVTVTSPVSGAVVETPTVTIAGTSSGASSIRLTEGSLTLAVTAVGAQGAWSEAVTLSDGLHSIAVTALDGGGAPVATTTIQFTVNAGQPPSGPVTISSPTHNSVLQSSSVSFGGTASGVAAVRLEKTGSPIATVPVFGGAWSAGPLNMAEGAHEVTAIPLDSNGNPYGAWTFVQFGVDTSPPTIEMSEADFPSPPFGPVLLNLGYAGVRGNAEDGLAVARVVVSYQPLGLDDTPTTVEANCTGCAPSFCLYCAYPRVEWWAEPSGLDTPGVYEVTATAYDLAGRSATTEPKFMVLPFGEGGPGGIFDQGPPNCWGPLEDSPLCFDPFDGGPFGPDSPICEGPIKDMFCEDGGGGGGQGRRRPA